MNTDQYIITKGNQILEFFGECIKVNTEHGSHSIMEGDKDWDEYLSYMKNHRLWEQHTIRNIVNIFCHKLFKDKDWDFYPRCMSKLNEHLAYMNEGLEVCADNPIKLKAIKEAILINRGFSVAIWAEKYQRDLIDKIGKIKAHFWIETSDGRKIDPQVESNREYWDVMAKAHLGTNNYKNVYIPASKHRQDECKELWINPIIKKYKNVLKKYKKCFADDMTWMDVALKYGVPDCVNRLGHCSTAAIINYMRNPNHHKIVYGDGGVQRYINGRFVGNPFLEYEDAWEDDGVGIVPKYMNKLTKKDFLLMMKNH